MRFKIGDIVRTSKKFRHNNPRIPTIDFKIIATDFPSAYPIRIERLPDSIRDLFKEEDLKLVRRPE